MTPAGGAYISTFEDECKVQSSTQNRAQNLRVQFKNTLSLLSSEMSD